MYFYQYKFITFWTPPQKNHSKYATDIPVPTIFGFSVLGNNIKIPVYTLIVQFYNFSYQKKHEPCRSNFNYFNISTIRLFSQ